jgi:L-cysteine:1D-myo-inositol 2-amino-2-deoxy-alpha-D-glucopyranoside ligase
LLAHHYRSDWEWTDADLSSAEARLSRWREAVALPSGPSADAVLDGVRRHLADDLDAPGALLVVDQWVAAAGSAAASDAAGSPHATSDAAAPELVARLVDTLLGVRLKNPG